MHEPASITDAVLIPHKVETLYVFNLTKATKAT